MGHYFIADESLPVNERELRFSFMGGDFIFKTNNGLFSYREVDYASRLLMVNAADCAGGLRENIQSLLDVGCGYGAVGIALAKTCGLELTMCDINTEALRYASVNAEKNGVPAKIIHSDGLSAVTGTFDIIVTNPPIHAGKETMFRIYGEAAERLNGGGGFYLVVQKKHGADSHAAFLEKIFKTVRTVYKKKGYFIFECTL